MRRLKGSVLVGGQATTSQLPGQAEREGADLPPPAPPASAPSGLSGLEGAHARWGGRYALVSLQIDVNFIGQPLADTREIMFSQICGRLRSVRLTLK